MQGFVRYAISLSVEGKTYINGSVKHVTPSMDHSQIFSKCGLKHEASCALSKLIYFWEIEQESEIQRVIYSCLLKFLSKDITEMCRQFFP